MDGEKVRQHLKDNGIMAKELATKLGISPQAMSGWLKSGSLHEGQKTQLKNALMLPKNFFDNSVSQIGDGNVNYGSVTAALNECEKERAVLQERVAQLTERLAEKDSTIKLLSKQLK